MTTTIRHETELPSYQPGSFNPLVIKQCTLRLQRTIPEVERIISEKRVFVEHSDLFDLSDEELSVIEEFAALAMLLVAAFGPARIFPSPPREIFEFSAPIITELLDSVERYIRLAEKIVLV